jgi:hypothetical protein
MPLLGAPGDAEADTVDVELHRAGPGVEEAGHHVAGGQARPSSFRTFGSKAIALN